MFLKNLIPNSREVPCLCEIERWVLERQIFSGAVPPFSSHPYVVCPLTELSFQLPSRIVDSLGALPLNPDEEASLQKCEKRYSVTRY